MEETMDLKEYQNKNCKGCCFADKPLVGSGEPCCTKPSRVDSDGITCKSKQPDKK